MYQWLIPLSTTSYLGFHRFRLELRPFTVHNNTPCSGRRSSDLADTAESADSPALPSLALPLPDSLRSISASIPRKPQRVNSSRSRSVFAGRGTKSSSEQLGCSSRSRISSLFRRRTSNEDCKLP